MTYKKYQKKLNTKSFAILNGVAYSFFAIIIFLMGVVLITNFFYDCYPISGSSMYPLLNSSGRDTDYIYLDEDVNATYGDVIIYKKTDGVLVIKRLIALPGDNITVQPTGEYVGEKQLFAIYIQYGGQGEFVKLDEPYVAYKTMQEKTYLDFYSYNVNKNFQTTDDGIRYIHLQQDEIFYCGDNRSSSSDCLDYGPQKKDNIIGKVKYIIKPNHLASIQILLQMLGVPIWR